MAHTPGEGLIAVDVTDASVCTYRNKSWLNKGPTTSVKLVDSWSFLNGAPVISSQAKAVLATVPVISSQAEAVLTTAPAVVP